MMRVVLTWGAMLALSLAFSQSSGDAKQVVNPPKKDDTIERIRNGVNGGQRNRLVNDGFEPIAPVNARAKEPVAFRASARVRGHALSYRLEGAPGDAMIDGDSGVFTWTPTLAGTVNFDIIASSKVEPSLFVKTRVTIVVRAPLMPFGHDFFATPRAALMARLQAMQGGIKPTTPVVADPKLVTNATGSGSNNQKPPEKKDPPVDPSAPENPPAQPAQAKQEPETPRFENPNTADALRYLVGPFDMMGSNVFVPAPDRYQVGPGDKLEIQYGSATFATQTAAIKVDPQGRIRLPISGRTVVVRGLTLEQVERRLQTEFQKDLREANVTVSLSELRSMTITVLGDAFLPGSYQVPSVATLFNVLYMFGGPNESGSLRRIELRRSNGTRRTFDLYRFLIFGDASQDVPLQPGDTIFIPTAESRVTVDGEVNRPAIYESLPAEGLREVLRLAGGVKASGVSQRVSLTTVKPGQGLKLEDVDLSSAEAPPVFGGDRVMVYSVRPVLTNVVSIEGAVDQPGQYAWEKGLTLRQLVTRARGLITGAYPKRAEITRLNVDESSSLLVVDLEKALAGDASQDVPLAIFDRIRIYKFDEVQWLNERSIAVRGAVRRPGNYSRPEGMRVIDALLQAGGLTNDAFYEQGFIQRFEADGTAGELLKIDIRKVLANDPSANLELKDRDELTILNSSEARFVPDQQVRLLGAVVKPGDFAAAKNLSLKDLLERGGGLLPSAGEMVEIARANVPEGTQHERYSLAEILAGGKTVPLLPGDLVTVPFNSDFRERPRTIVILGAVKNPGPYSINGTTDKIGDLIDRAGGLRENAFPRGTQYYRDPQKLKTLAQERLGPRIREVLDLVAVEEYNRAVARAEIEKARLMRSVNQPQTSISLTGQPVSQNQTPVPVTIPEKTVTQARKLDPTDVVAGGNLNINLESALRGRGDRNNLIVEDGDIVIIPETPSTVNVVGAVTVPSALLFEPGKNVRFYIDRVGGPTADAGTRILIIRANGQVVRADARTRVELGDLIFVPTKVMAERLTDRQSEIDAISRNITSAGVLFAVIRALLR